MKLEHWMELACEGGRFRRSYPGGTAAQVPNIRKLNGSGVGSRDGGGVSSDGRICGRRLDGRAG